MGPCCSGVGPCCSGVGPCLQSRGTPGAMALEGRHDCVVVDAPSGWMETVRAWAGGSGGVRGSVRRRGGRDDAA